MGKHQILIVEDDPFMLDLEVLHVENDGYTVSSASSGKEMFAIMRKEPIDLVLLDLGLPDEDGLALTRQIRARSTVPIIVITARQEMEDKIAALEMGADDFLTKPVNFDELLLRVRNLLGRSRQSATVSSTKNNDDEFMFEGWALNTTGRTLTAPEGNDVHLTPGEFNVLQALCSHSNKIMSRDQLLDATSRGDDPPSFRMIDVFVSRLRKKIEANPRKPRFIITMSKHGYKFTGLNE